MSWNSQNYARLQYAEGRLVWSPTDLSADFPYGGTDLGRVVDKVLYYNRGYRDITAEEFGGDLAETFELGGPAIFAAMLMGVTDAAWQRVFASADGSSQKVFSNTATPGAKLSGAPLLFVANDLANHNGVLMHHVFPTIPQEAATRFAADQRLGLPVVFRLARDPSSNKVWDQGLFEDLAL